MTTIISNTAHDFIRRMNSIGTGTEQQGQDADVTVIDRPPVEERKDEQEPAKPAMWSILLHNDNSSSPMFVIQVLNDAFSVTAEAQRIMMAAHTGGKAVVKVTTKEIAETQLNVAQAMIANAQNRVDYFRRDDGGCELTFTIQEESAGE